MARSTKASGGALNEGDRRKLYMKDGPPLCSRCGVNHWRYWSCDKAAEKHAVEAVNTAAREQVFAQTAVIPQARTRLPKPRFQGRNFTMQAPGVYRRVRER